MSAFSYVDIMKSDLLAISDKRITSYLKHIKNSLSYHRFLTKNLDKKYDVYRIIDNQLVKPIINVEWIKSDTSPFGGYFNEKECGIENCNFSGEIIVYDTSHSKTFDIDIDIQFILEHGIVKSSKITNYEENCALFRLEKEERMTESSKSLNITNSQIINFFEKFKKKFKK